MLLESSAAAEWRRNYMLPVGAAFGYATSLIHFYGFGPYIEPIGTAFGWSRAQTTVGLTIALLVQAVLVVPLGFLIDRHRPRPFGIAGVVLITAAFAALSTAGGDSANWYVLWALIGFAALPAQATIWTRVVAGHFDRSRGLALAVTMCGASLASAIFPLLAAFLIETQGWRRAIALQAGLWLALALPIVLLFFKGKTEEGATADEHRPTPRSHPALWECVTTTIYLRLISATFLFGISVMALVVHFVPILTGYGANPVSAAGIASLIGISAIVGRLGTGLLLDRYRASHVGATAFLLPALSCGLILLGGDADAFQIAAALLLGLALGAEIDVLAYLTVKYFGLSNFATLFSGQLTALCIATAFGPLGAAAMFDRLGNYSTFLFFVAGAMVISSVVLATLPSPGVGAQRSDR